MVQHIIHGIGQERTTFGDFDRTHSYRFIYNFVIRDIGVPMSSKGDREEKRLKEYEKCDHDWRPAGTTEGHTHLRLVCSKCGETTLIELFP